jgi:hypothetical protein
VCVYSDRERVAKIFSCSFFVFAREVCGLLYAYVSLCELLIALFKYVCMEAGRKWKCVVCFVLCARDV